MILIKRVERHDLLENVIVSSKFRGLGIGKRLMKEIERISKGMGCYYTMHMSYL